MVVVYIAGPFRGYNPDGSYSYWAQHHNITKAENLAWQVWEAGAVALAPHLNTVHFQGSLPDHVWLDGDIELLKRCDACLMVEGWKESKGATSERHIALELGIPVLYSIEEVKGLVAESNS